MTFKSHLESGGEQCPKCGSKAIRPNGPPERIIAGQTRVAMFCATCGARWCDIFTLVKAEEL